MDRIIITEQDLTTNNIAEEQIVDIAFVPGFSNASGSNPVGAYVPTLCTSVSEFEAYFGTTPATFISNQEYPDKFDSSAIPVAGIGEADEDGNSETIYAQMFTAGGYDPSYIYAKELLYAGLPVMYYRCNEVTDVKDTGYDVTVAHFYDVLENKLLQLEQVVEKDGSISKAESPLLDKGEYQFKYFTTGGYPTFEYDSGALTEKMAHLCAMRGDCVAFIDHTDNHDRPLVGIVDGVKSVYTAVAENTIADLYDTYATMITPWCSFRMNGSYTDASQFELPGSFAYLKCLAKMLASDSDWLAVAGVARGKVPDFKSMCTSTPLTNSIADSYQQEPNNKGRGVSINAITNVKPYGYCIWGNRTFRNADETRTGFALNFLNIRNLVSDVKKQAYVAAKSLMFEQNSDILWLNFKSLLTPMLDQMVSGEGLSSYKLVKNVSQDKTRLSATIRLYPMYAVESFEIAITLEDEEVSVE